ncbi:hypothetical protein BT96DRAFT_891363 [Gymnopus androsaceus JB14]|uniref:Uncharacterized protein n=1 Tax=Gymnopus androsaceus JB14 TaxID=1447944 RepID=A0A6A4GM48_9AGAR|nr:hypothetical protein BT96DRAFT_891363 [Gymnopus androsaceus JB14]
MSSPSIVVPHVVPREWSLKFDCSAVPSEQEILLRAGYKPDGITNNITGINTSALACAASHALAVYETPTITLANRGGFNTLFLLEFPSNKQKVLARIPNTNARAINRTESSAATMTFALHVRHIPAPRVFAWNANDDNPVGVRYIIQEYFDDVVEPWQGWGTSSEDRKSHILDELAKWHVAFLAPMPPPLQKFGDLGFAQGLPNDTILSDPNSYVVRPPTLRIMHQPYLASSTSLPLLWDDLWSHQKALCMTNGGLDREALMLDDNDSCDAASFADVASQVLTFSRHALSVLAHNPTYAQPCLVNYDYAFRNILLDRDTCNVKAFIDWDDVHIMPFIVGVDYPDDINNAVVAGLATDDNYYLEGPFRSFPPDERGEILDPLDKDGNLIDAVLNRNERIEQTMYRDRFIRGLEISDQRIAQPEMWDVRRPVLKAHFLLRYGGHVWWKKRQWLRRQVENRL